jgi:kynurenine formamidase
MLNHIDDAKRRAAMRLVREGRLYDLSHVLDESVPVFPGRYFRQTLVTTAHHANTAMLVDVSGLDLGPGDVITVDHLAGIDPEPGDAVLFHTGWSTRWTDPDAYLEGEPGPGYAVADWLVEHGVALTGCDTWSYGPVPGEDTRRPFEVPQRLNAVHGVFVVENLNTAELARDGVREFALVLTHPKLRGASGAWTAPIALI